MKVTGKGRGKIDSSDSKKLIKRFLKSLFYSTQTYLDIFFLKNIMCIREFARSQMTVGVRGFVEWKSTIFFGLNTWEYETNPLYEPIS